MKISGRGNHTLTSLGLFVLLLWASTACQDKAAMAELEKFRARAKLEQQNKEVVRNFFAAVDRNDFATLRELCSPDFTLIAPGLTEPLTVDTTIQLIKTNYAAFPDWEHTIEDIIAEGNIVVAKITQNGTHKGPYEGIPPTEKKVTQPSLYQLIVINGKVKGCYVIEEELGFYQQLGMELELRPKEAKKR
jgi:predicted ester cyclase